MTTTARFRRPLALAPLLLLALGQSSCERSGATAAEPQKAPLSETMKTPSWAKEATGETAPSIAPLTPGARSEYEQNSIDVFKAVAPSVVFVTNKQLVRDRWSMRTMEVSAGQGTGFVWDRQGHIVTNYHVIDKGRAFEVTLYGGKTLPAKLVGGDPRKDIAVLKIDPPSSMQPIAVPAASSTVDVGQKAVAIGNPFGFDHTMTVGVISATGREMVGFGGVTIRDMLQTDASINPGNSGGPLLDSQGQLIGINTMITSKSGGSAGVGFAVPVSAVRRVVPDLIKYGRTRRAGLGIELVRDEVARANGVDGVVISTVEANSAAARVGLRGLEQRGREVFLGDVITKIDRFEVHSYDDMYNALDHYKPGQNVKVTVQRGSTKKSFDIKLMRLP